MNQREFKAQLAPVKREMRVVICHQVWTKVHAVWRERKKRACEHTRGVNISVRFGSQFFITTAPAPHLNGRHVVFGEVVDGKGRGAEHRV